MSAQAVINTRAFRDAYGVVDAALRVRQAKLYCILALVLVPACVGLDYFVYPHYVWQILLGRLLCDLAILPCFLALFTKWGHRHVVFLSKAPPLAPCITICWMIYATEGVLSPYYAGINVVLVGVILLIPYTLREAGVICGIVTACYALACVLHKIYPPANQFQGGAVSISASTLFNNLYFLGMTTVIALSSCHYTSLRRLEEFRLRYELDANNRELATTLSKLKETEVQLVQSEKMNALGKLSAGLLHEINNPLNFTFMALQVAEQEVGENEELRDTIKDIGQGMERIRTVISDLRAFAYPSKQMEFLEFSIEEALTTALRLTAHELAEIPVIREGVSEARALGAKSQVVQIFINLLMNSAHAIKEKSSERDPRITVTYTPRADRIRVAVKDNGAGVAAADLPRLLDPFFTTKAPGQGMGLGLSICDTIVKNHGGVTAINSERGQWTEVSFDLALAPISARSAA